MDMENTYEIINRDEEENIPYEVYTINFKLGDYEMVLEWKSKSRLKFKNQMA